MNYTKVQNNVSCNISDTSSRTLLTTVTWSPGVSLVTGSRLHSVVVAAGEFPNAEWEGTWLQEIAVLI